MKSILYFSVFLFLFIISSRGKPLGPGIYSSPLSKFAFGSCNKHDRPQPLWDHIIKYNPELWLWLGDIVYADTRKTPLWWEPSSLALMEYKYDAQKNNPGYKELVQKVNITGVWDDHDYGINNGGEDYKDKRGSQRLILSFLDEPATSDRWKQEGLYTSFEFGDSEKNNKLKLIILDTRYFRSEPSNENSDILGEQQWQWLEEQLKGSDAQIHIFGSSVQLIPADIPIVEKWSDFTHGRTKFLSLLQKYKVSTPIVLSGDVHHAELFHYTCDQSTLVVHEITSSGMTHYCGSTFPPIICNFVLNTILHGQFSLGSYDGFNYGTVEIDWSATPVTVELQVRNSNANIVMSQTVVAAPTLEGNTLCPEHIPRHVHWQGRTWVTLIIACLLSIIACVIYMLIFAYRRVTRLLQLTIKKKE